jgi:hypothetical protein
LLAERLQEPIHFDPSHDVLFFKRTYKYIEQPKEPINQLEFLRMAQIQDEKMKDQQEVRAALQHLTYEEETRRIRELSAETDRRAKEERKKQERGEVRITGERRPPPLLCIVSRVMKAYCRITHDTLFQL